MNIIHNKDIDFWYQYMNTVNIINCHDAFYAAENGADNDGDAIFTTDNEILLRKTKTVPAIVCVQKKAKKCVITDENLAAANKNSFGDEIGAITNRITAMYDIMTKFKKGTKEYETLEYRIKCGQMYQQDCIDRSKGIISKPMPKMWYDIYSVIPKEDDNKETIPEKEFNRQIIADKKPYFMIYVYPQLKREYRKFIKSAKKSCQSQYNISLDELLKKTDRDEKQEAFVKWYYKKYPVSDENGVMNRLCHYVEKEFEGYLHSVKVKDYPFRELLASNDYGTDYIGKEKIDKIKELFYSYKTIMQNMSIIANTQYFDNGDFNTQKLALDEWFKRECDFICISSKKQCDILLKLCYSNEQSKRFVWKMCGYQIINNLLKRKGSYSYFIRDKDGELKYKGENFKKITVKVSEEIEE